MRKTLTPRTVAAVAIAATAAAVLAGSAIAANTKVVPPTGSVAGRDYGGWLAKWWQLRLATPPTGSICQRVGRVEVLIGGPVPKGPKRCSVKPGRPVYVNGPSSECSTIEKPPSHGDTARQLRRCARRGFAAIGRTRVKVDGTVLHLGHWVVATHAYRVRLPKQNILGSSRRHGRSAAYGSGFILRNLSRGTHVVRETGSEAGRPIKLVYKIRVGG
jgi:hypothetical protein